MSRFVVLVIALQILNLSVYSGDFDIFSTTDTQKTIGEYNQIDFLIEYVAEIVLDHKDAFPENGVHNHHNSLVHQMKHICIKINNYKRNSDVDYCDISSSVPVSLKTEYKYLFANEIIPPPPKA
jgi:hypothetical protein